MSWFQFPKGYTTQFFSTCWLALNSHLLEAIPGIWNCHKILFECRGDFPCDMIDAIAVKHSKTSLNMMNGLKPGKEFVEEPRITISLAFLKQQQHAHPWKSVSWCSGRYGQLNGANEHTQVHNPKYYSSTPISVLKCLTAFHQRGHWQYSLVSQEMLQVWERKSCKPQRVKHTGGIYAVESIKSYELCEWSYLNEGYGDGFLQSKGGEP